LIEQGRAARTAGRVNEAREALGSALTLSPSSAMILEELATVEQDSGELGHAEELARRLVRFEPSNPGYLARLAGVLEARGNLVEAASVYARAAAIEPRDEWRTKASSLRTRAEEAALPAPVRAIPTAKSVTRADVAAFIGLRLTSLLQQAPQRPVQVATDIGGHWAARWIAPVTRAGVMGVYDNHTFQPQATVRRGDLAQIAANLLELPGASLGPDLARWRAARPRFSDLPATHVFYGPVALAVASGVLNADAAGRFDATRPATGAELVGAVDRISQLGQRR